MTCFIFEEQGWCLFLCCVVRYWRSKQPVLFISISIRYSWSLFDVPSSIFVPLYTSCSHVFRLSSFDHIFSNATIAAPLTSAVPRLTPSSEPSLSISQTFNPSSTPTISSMYRCVSKFTISTSPSPKVKHRSTTPLYLLPTLDPSPFTNAPSTTRSLNR